ncbi:hypothetical protein Tco_0966933 [Tanacetum coccineum]
MTGISVIDEFETSAQIKEEAFKDNTFRNNNYESDGKVVSSQDGRGRYNATNQGRPFQRKQCIEEWSFRNRGGMINPGQVKPSSATLLR